MLASADATAAAAAAAAGRGNIVALKDGTVSYSLARSPLRLPGSADI